MSKFQLTPKIGHLRASKHKNPNDLKKVTPTNWPLGSQVTPTNIVLMALEMINSFINDIILRQLWPLLKY